MENNQEESDEKFGFEEYEIRGATKIQHVLKTSRNVDISFRDACLLWRKFSDEKYCASWMSMEAFIDLDAKILFAHDAYIKKA